MRERLWKFLNEEGAPCYGDSRRWLLPRDGQLGDWMPAIEGELVPGQRGYHAYRDRDLTCWLGPVLYRVEACGEVLSAKHFVVCRKVRLLYRVDAWDERVARLLACDYADSVLPLYEAEYPEDERPRRILSVAQRYAWGRAEEDEFYDAWRLALPLSTEALSVAKRSPEPIDASWAAVYAASAIQATVNNQALEAVRSARHGALSARRVLPLSPAAQQAERQQLTDRLLHYLGADTALSVDP